MIPEFLLSLPLDKIKKEADAQHVPWDVCCAIIWQESRGKHDVVRYEAHYSYLDHPGAFAHSLLISHNTEVALQRMSWGYFQIMGGVARQHGYKKMLTNLIDPKLNIYYGVRHIRGLMYRYSEEEQVISAYNQGSARKRNGMYVNQKYVDSVYRYLREIRSIIK